MLQRRIGPAYVQAAGGEGEIGRDFDLHSVRVNHHRGTGLHNLLYGLHARPDTRETAHGEGVDAQVQYLLHVSREEHRRAAGLENVVALVRSGGAFGDVVIPRHRYHAAPLGGARHVGVFEHVRAAVYPRALAVPNAKYPIVFVAAHRCIAQLLRTPDGGCCQLFVHAGLKHDMVGLQVFFSLRQHLVVAA